MLPRIKPIVPHARRVRRTSCPRPARRLAPGSPRGPVLPPHAPRSHPEYGDDRPHTEEEGPAVQRNGEDRKRQRKSPYPELRLESSAPVRPRSARRNPRPQRGPKAGNGAPEARVCFALARLQLRLFAPDQLVAENHCPGITTRPPIQFMTAAIPVASSTLPKYSGLR